MLIDATAKGDLPPVALPKREYMERARKIWEDLGLPPLKPESPWYGYSLGEWNDVWENAAQRAAKGDWLANGKRSERHVTRDAEPQSPARNIPLD